LSYTFFSGSPGLMRAKIHSEISTVGMTGLDRKHIREQVREVIHKQLIQYESKETNKQFGFLTR
jgi:1-acyl-sn-glycerol-3-phosphate acyltransferase